MKIQEILESQQDEGVKDVWDAGVAKVKKWLAPKEKPAVDITSGLDPRELQALKSTLFNVLEKRPLDYRQTQLISKIYKRL